jgi:uncharacterized OsmC-like protein
MIDMEPIAYAFSWISELFRREPERALNTATSHIRLDDKLTCTIQEGPWTLVADMSEKAGGGGKGPSPGVLGRAALGSCIAIRFVMEASRAGVPVHAVDVEVEADFDDGALFGVSDAPAGYLEVRYRVSVESDADEETLRSIAARANARSPYLDVFGRAQSLVGSVEVRRPVVA